MKNETQNHGQNHDDFFETVKKWKQNRFKDKIDKANQRHPMMTLLRSSAENRLIKMFENKDYKPISIFEEKNIEPTKFDLKYTYNLWIQKNKTKDFLIKCWGSIKNFFSKVNEKRTSFKNNLDSKFAVYLEREKQEKILSINQTKKSLENLRSSESNKKSRLKRLRIYLFSKLLNYQTKEASNPLLIKILSNEKGYYHSYQMWKMRVKNGFCSAFYIKKNYVVDYVKTQTIKYPETIFYKIFKVYFNLKVINRRNIFLGVSSFLLYKLLSYKLSITNKISLDNDYNTEEINALINKLQKDMEMLQSKSGNETKEGRESNEKDISDTNDIDKVYKPYIPVFNNEMDFKFLNTMKFEKELLEYIINYEKYVDQKEEINKKFMEYSPNILNELIQVSNTILLRNAGLSFLNIFICISYFLYNKFKRNIIVKKSLVRTVVLYYILKEVLDYVDYFNYVNLLKSIQSMLLFKKVEMDSAVEHEINLNYEFYKYLFNKTKLL